MFGFKKIREQIRQLDNVHCVLIEEVATANKKTQESVDVLKEQILALQKQVAELSKKTISQTTQEEKPITYNQIIDEWINGSTEEQNG
jgi:dimeric dUTPase (all-alpha-NTP-PPase superfamily)